MPQKEDETTLVRLEILSARRMDFLRNLLQAVDAKLPGVMSTYDKRRLHDALARIVSELPVGLFISEREASSHELDASLALVDLRLDSQKIWGEVVKQLKTAYPELASKLDARRAPR